MLLALLLACNDYDLHDTTPHPPGPRDAEAEPVTDSGIAGDTAAPEDTEDSPTDEGHDTTDTTDPDTEDTQDPWQDWLDWLEDHAGDTGGEPVGDTDFPAATGDVYANTDTELFVWDTSTHALGRIGTFRDWSTGYGCARMVDIAIDLNGGMVGTCGNMLVRIDPTDATTEELVDLGEEDVGLTFLADGTLIAAGSGSVRSLDANGRLHTIYSGAFETSGDLVGLPDGKLYWSILGGDDLATLDPSTGTGHRIGALGNGATMWGLAFADGVLYGFDASGEIVSIDPASGDTTHVQGTNHGWYGATTNPVTW
jgi:hypothetical protein